MDDRVANFLNNRVGANIANPSQKPDDHLATLKAHYLTDAVAAGIQLDDVNESWPEAEQAIEKAQLGTARKALSHLFQKGNLHSLL